MMNPESEEWRSIPGLERYEASSLGRVRHKERKVPLKGHVNRAGYPAFGYVDIDNKDARHYKTRNMFFHQAVALAFHGQPSDPSLIVMHLDNDKTNNRPENLKWGTRAENNAQAMAGGLHGPSGKTHCKNGHPLSGENISYRPAYNRRVCKQCKRDSSKRSYWADKSAESREPIVCGYRRVRDGGKCEKLILPGRTSCGFHPPPEGLVD